MGTAGILFVGLISMVVIYGALRTAQKAMHEVADVEEPTSAAAYEMEINVIGTGLGVLKYLDTGDPQYRDRVEKTKPTSDVSRPAMTSWRRPRRERSWELRSALSSRSSFNWAET